MQDTKKPLFQENKFFYKMDGTGNDFILIFHQNQSEEELKSFAKKVCHPKFGIGADGLLIIQRPNQKNKFHHMKIFTSDGSYLSMCGNGLRCYCALLHHLKLQNHLFEISSDAGNKKVQVTQDKEGIEYMVKSAMGNPQENSFKNITKEVQQIVNEVEFAFIMVFGVPQMVVKIDKAKQDKDYIALGIKIQQKINSYVNFIFYQKSENISEVNCVTLEMGGKLALSCGTGVCATFYALYQENIVKDKCLIKTPGGNIQISYENGNVMKNGPARLICSGYTYVK